MKKILVLLALLTSPVYAGDLFLELGAGHDRHIDEGRNPQSVMRVRYEMDNTWLPHVIEFNHHSSIPDGLPFNRNQEDLVNQWSLIWRFKLSP